MQKSTPQNMAADYITSLLVPPLDIKNYMVDDWNSWFTQFNDKALVTEFPSLPQKEKVAVLLEKLGDGMTPILETFNVKFDEVSYEELIDLLTSYFRPAITRHVFFSAKQKTQESFDDFAQRLTVLSSPCCFGPLRDGILRDVYLLNLCDTYNQIRNSILERNRNPVFYEAVILSKELLKEFNAPLGCTASDIDSSLTHNNLSFKAEPSEATSSLQADQAIKKEGSSIKLARANQIVLGGTSFVFERFADLGAPRDRNRPNTRRRVQ